MTALQFAKESVVSVLGEIRPLLQRHWDEIAHYRDVPLDPDYEAYLRMDLAGRVAVFTARDSGVLVGYAVFLLGNLHYRNTPIATQDVLFLHPDHRGGAGLRFLRHCDDALARMGMRVVYHHVKAHADFSALLQRLGYERVDFIYGKRM